MKVTLQPGEIHIIHDNPFRSFLQVTCSGGDFQLDETIYPNGALVQRIQAFGENPSRQYKLKNPNSISIECTIEEEIVVG